MAGPGGREVGRIAIRVLPDTSRFSTSLQSYLDRIERRAQVKVKAVADTSRFASEMRGELSRVRARIEVPVTPNTSDFADRVRTELSRTSARMRVPVQPDTRGFTARLREELASSRQSVAVRVVPDVADFERRMLVELNFLRRVRLRVGLLPDVSEFRVRLERQLRSIRATLSVLVTPNFAGFRRSLRRELGGIDIELPVVLAVVDGEIERLRAELRAIRPPLAVPVRFDADRSALNRLQSNLGSLGNIGGRLAMVTALVGGLAAAIGNAVPAAAALVTQLAQMAPAAAVGATAVLSIVTATTALKIGTQGVGEALKNAFDPDSAEAFAEALKKLTPNAQAFVLAVQKLAPEFSKLRKAVQERLFEGLDKQITATATAALPVLRRGLENTADSLNAMGKGVLSTARDLARSGTLGKAIDGANKGLSNLEKIPGRFVKGLTEIAVAASPAFDRITKAADRASKRISDRITKGLETGGLERAIDRAIDKVKQLGRVGRNLGDILGNVFGPAADVGGDFLSILEDITSELAKVTGSKGAQSAFRAIFSALADVGQTAGRLLGEALKAIGPALQALVGPLREVVWNLEAGLRPVIQALSPILKTLATTIGGVARELSPFLRVAGDLVAMLLTALQPVLKAMGDQLVLIAGTLKRLLIPAWEAMLPVLQPIVDLIGRLLGATLSLTNRIIKELQPAFDAIGQAMARAWEALQPLTEKLTELADRILPKLKPIIDPIIETIGELAVVFADGLGRVITEIVIPAIEAIIALLEGDFRTAWSKTGVVVTNATVFIGDVLSKLPGVVGRILQQLALVLLQEVTKAMRDFEAWVQRGAANVVGHFSKLPGKARSALSDLGWQVSTQARAELSELVSAVDQKIKDAVARIAALPGRASAALSGARSYLYSAGVNLVLGLIDGVLSRANAIANAARGVVERAVAAAKGALGINSPSKVFMEIGEQTGQGLVVGLDGMRRDVAKSMGSLVGVPSMRLSTMANLSTVTAGGGDRVVEGTLLLDSGELMGKFRGVLVERDQQLLSTLRASRKG